MNEQTSTKSKRRLPWTAKELSSKRIRINVHATIGRDVEIGTDVDIYDRAVIGNGVKIGNDVSIADKVTIGHFSTINNNVTICNNVTIGMSVYIGKGVSIGRFSRIEDGVKMPDGAIIGEYASISAHTKSSYIVSKLEQDTVSYWGEDLVNVNSNTMLIDEWIEKINDQIGSLERNLVRTKDMLECVRAIRTIHNKKLYTL